MACLQGTTTWWVHLILNHGLAIPDNLHLGQQLCQDPIAARLYEVAGGFGMNKHHIWEMTFSIISFTGQCR